MSGLDQNLDETWNADTAPVERRAHNEKPHSHQLHGGAPEEQNPHAHDRHTVSACKWERTNCSARTSAPIKALRSAKCLSADIH